MLTDKLREPIGGDFDKACAWIAELVRLNLHFHLEDDPLDIIKVATGERLFDDFEAGIVRDRQVELYALDWGDWECPIGYMLFLLKLKESGDEAPD